jgi:hypothetical protein
MPICADPEPDQIERPVKVRQHVVGNARSPFRFHHLRAGQRHHPRADRKELRGEQAHVRQRVGHRHQPFIGRDDGDILPPQPRFCQPGEGADRSRAAREGDHCVAAGLERLFDQEADIAGDGRGHLVGVVIFPPLHFSHASLLRRVR